MKRELLAWAGVALLCVAPACGPIEKNPPPMYAVQLQELAAQEAEALEFMAENPAPADQAAGQALLDAVEAERTRIEIEHRKGLGESIGGMVGTLWGPAGVAAAGLAGAILGPMTGKRGQKHLWQSAKSFVPYPGDMSISIGDAWDALRKAMGAKHSSEASKKAAEGEA